MTKQVFHEDVETGAEIPALVKHPTTMQLVKWAGASGDYYPIHYDKDLAQSSGLPGVVVHGWLICSFLGQMITDWMGEQGFLKKLSCRYLGLNFPCENVTCKGKVAKKYVQNSEHYVECEIWAENPKGERTVSGTAMVILPSRG